MRTNNVLSEKTLREENIGQVRGLEMKIGPCMWPTVRPTQP